MLRSGRELHNARILATDGEIGHVEDFYFDDLNWQIRYLVVDTRNWLPGRKVLISPESVIPGQRGDRQVRVNLTKDQIRNSPDISTHPPVSKQGQADLAAYYGWANVPVGMVPVAGFPSAAATEVPPPAIAETAEGDPHLRSMLQVIGYKVESPDGEIGKVDDFAISAERPEMEFVVVETGKWLAGRMVTVPVGDVKDIDWADQLVRIRTPRSVIERQPEYTRRS